MDDKYEKLEKLFEEPTSNTIHAIYDQFVEENAKQYNKMGIKRVIVRREVGKCCDWCKSLTGVYDYSAGKYPDDIFKRHDNCKCMVTTQTEKGKWQDAWSKKEFDTQKEAREERLKNIEDNITNELKINKSPYGDNVESVYKEYVKNIQPSNGKVIKPNKYKTKKHIEEIETAKWWSETFGEDVELLIEGNEKKADYFLKKHLWELKTPKSRNGVDGLIRKGIHQIEKDPGGIILDVRYIPPKKYFRAIKDAVQRITRTSEKSIDLMVKNKKKIISILRIKK